MSKMIGDHLPAQFSSLGIAQLRPIQTQVIESVLDGNDTLALIPTGGGKSLCYWLAGSLLGKTTLAIFPLTALMEEQAAKLRALGFNVLVLNADTPWREAQTALIGLANQTPPDFIFTSPERIATDGLLEAAIRKARDRVGLFVVDEVHCISQWGTDFRPFFKELPAFLESVWGGGSRPRFLGLSATMSKQNIEQIKADFSSPTMTVIRDPQGLRRDVMIQTRRVANDVEKETILWDTLLKHPRDKILVFVENRRSGPRSTEAFAQRAAELGIQAAYFHSDMPSQEKHIVRASLRSGEVRVLFCTSAFGMGMDIPDIRGVIHFRPPASIEEFYQQIGRAGRDKKDAWALTLWTEKNFEWAKRHFVDATLPTANDLATFNAESLPNLGIQTFNYFESDDTRQAFHLLNRYGALKTLCKAVSPLTGFKSHGNARLTDYQKATRRGHIVATASALGISPCEVAQAVFTGQLDGTITATIAPSRTLVVERFFKELPPGVLDAIDSSLQAVRLFKHAQIDDLAKLLQGSLTSSEIHDEIGEYLGLDQWNLGCKYLTLSGDWVRSKSEVIIANILFREGIEFYYEHSLTSRSGGLRPDFTLKVAGHTYFWEHLGLLDDPEYAGRWALKQRVYDSEFPGQLITTQESPRLSDRVLEELDKLRKSTSDNLAPTSGR